MGFNTTKINGTTYEYHSENEGRRYGDIDTPTLHEAVDYFHGDGRVALQVERHTAFVSQGNSIHLHVLPHKDKQCPEDSHGCIMSWGMGEFENMLDGLRVMAKGIEVNSEPKKLLETMDAHMDEYRSSDLSDSRNEKNRVPRVE